MQTTDDTLAGLAALGLEPGGAARDLSDLDPDFRVDWPRRNAPVVPFGAGQGDVITDASVALTSRGELWAGRDILEECPRCGQSFGQPSSPAGAHQHGCGELLAPVEAHVDIEDHETARDALDAVIAVLDAECREETARMVSEAEGEVRSEAQRIAEALTDGTPWDNLRADGGGDTGQELVLCEAEKRDPETDEWVLPAGTHEITVTTARPAAVGAWLEASVTVTLDGPR